MALNRNFDEWVGQTVFQSNALKPLYSTCLLVFVNFWTHLIIAKLQIIDPDVILGHNFESVDYGVLLHRMKDCSTAHWSKLGRLRRTEWPKGFGRGGTSWAERQIVGGRLICDLSNDMGRVNTVLCSF